MDLDPVFATAPVLAGAEREPGSRHDPLLLADDGREQL
jgi:hypothetical protein